MPHSIDCNNIAALKIADIRAYIQKRGWDIKARSKAELCAAIKRAHAQHKGKRRPKPLSSARIREFHSNCLKNTLCESRVQTSRMNIPVSERTKADYCAALKKYYKKMPRIQKIASKCEHKSREATARAASRIRIGSKTLYDYVKKRIPNQVPNMSAKNALCYRLNALGGVSTRRGIRV